MALSTSQLSTLLASLGGIGGAAAGGVFGHHSSNDGFGGPGYGALGGLAGAGLGYLAGQAYGDEDKNESGFLRRYLTQGALRGSAAFGASPENSAAAAVPMQVAGGVGNLAPILAPVGWAGTLAGYGVAPFLAKDKERILHVANRTEGQAVKERWPSLIAATLAGGATGYGVNKMYGGGNLDTPTAIAGGAVLGLGTAALGSWLTQRVINGASGKTKVHAAKVLTDSPYTSGYLPFGDVAHAISEKK
jgi:hypothetical protein